MFVSYCKGVVSILPWSDIEGLHLESREISEQLVLLNKAGYLTINSQPRLNGVKSNHAAFGWGSPDG